MTTARNPWARLGWDAWMLGAEAANVIVLRSLKLALGGDRTACRLVAW